MIKTLRKTGWQFIGNAMILLLFFSCEKEEEKTDHLVEDIQAIVKEYEAYKNQKDSANSLHKRIRKNIKGNIHELDLDIINKLCLWYYGYWGNNDVVISKITSISERENFQNAHFINQYYANYFIAFKYAESLNPTLALEFAIKADKALGENHADFMDERIKIRELMLETSSLYVNLSDKKIKNYKKKFYEYDVLDPLQVINKLRSGYNITYQFSLAQDWKNTIEWADKTIAVEKTPSQNKYFADLVNLKMKALVRQERFYELSELKQKVHRQYETHEISLPTYNKLKVFSLQYLWNTIEPKELLQEIEALKNYYGETCKHRYTLSLLYNVEIQYFESIGNWDEQKKALQKKLHAVKNCGKTDEYFITQEYQAIESLLQLSLYNNEHLPTDLLERKSEIDSILLASKTVLWKLNKYYSNNELAYAAQENKYKESRLKFHQKNKTILTSIIGICVLGIGFVLLLLKRNMQIQRKIKEKNSSMELKNIKITELNNQMEFIVNELEKSNKSLETFAHSAALDIQSPLKNFNQQIQQLSTPFLNHLDEEDREVIGFMQKSVDQLNEMIIVLLQYSKPEKQMIVHEKIETKEILEMVEKSLSESISESQTLLYYPDQLPLVKGNRSLLKQVFLNIINNAIKYKSPYRKPEIFISYKETLDGNSIQFAIKDNGIGIPEHKRKLIFNVFKRLYQDKSIEGIGLGLATCKRIIEDFGGTIWVESELGSGSTFYFTIHKYRTENNYIPTQKNRDALLVDQAK